MRLVLISDTHTHHRRLTMPDGDVLIHAGDVTSVGSINDLDDFNAWLGGLPYHHKLYIAGNHDWCFFYRRKESEACIPNARYLQDESVTIDGVRFYGSPWQPAYFGWAFNLPRGAALRTKWERIPVDTDVLITHGPPHHIGDMTIRHQRAGCVDLRDIVAKLRLRLHVFGHIHEAYGAYNEEITTFVNASSITVDKKAMNSPLVFDL